MEKKCVLIVGVGGQGTILAAKILVRGLAEAGYDVKMSEVHGMSQRGGSVSTQVHYGEKVWSPLAGKGAADYLLAFEKMEALRYADMLRPDGIAVVNDYAMASSTVAAGLEEYPEGCIEAMQEAFRTYVVDAAGIAENLGDARCMNVVLLGAMTKIARMDETDWESVIRQTVPEKTMERNCAAFRAGRAAVTGIDHERMG